MGISSVDHCQSQLSRAGQVPSPANEPPQPPQPPPSAVQVAWRISINLTKPMINIYWGCGDGLLLGSPHYSVSPNYSPDHSIRRSVGWCVQRSGAIHDHTVYSYSCTDASYRYIPITLYIKENDHWSQYKINELEDWHPESLTVWPLELAAPADVLLVTWRLRLIPAQQPVQSQSSGRRNQKPRTFRGNAPQCSWFSAWWDGTH